MTENIDEIVMNIIEKAREEGRRWLLEPEAKEICKLYGINVPESYVVRSIEEAVEVAKKLGYPVVLKIVSPQVLHKSDVGGVIININSERDLEEAYNKIISNVKEKVPNLNVKGFLIEKMARPSTEVIVGMTRDPQFGPVIMFGLGGIFVELFRDVSFRIAPLERRDAEEMVREIKAYPLLEGFRGREPADIDSLINLILKVSKFSMEFEDVKEIDLNPIFIYRDGLIAVDARIILT